MEKPMSRVFADVGITLDGFIAGLNGGAKNPLGDGGLSIHDWMFKQKAFLSHLKLEGGETNNKDNDIIEETFSRISANIMGKRMFEEGEANWPEEAPFNCPVYVLTHQKRDPWERKGGTTFYFTDDEIHKVLERAKKDAGKKDVRISGGAIAIRQFLNAGLIDEFNLHLTPIILGKGVRLFDNVDKEKISFQILEVFNSPIVTHLKYKVINHMEKDKNQLKASIREFK
jgi:dihydrofolate reductase